MKTTLTILFLLCLFKMNICLGQQRSEYFNDKDSVFINGKIIGFDPQNGDAFINFLTTEINGSKIKHAFQISPDGCFEIALFQHFAGDITMNYKTAFTNLFTLPGSHLQIQIQNCAVQNGKQDSDVFSAYGELNEVNNLLFEFEHEMRLYDFIYEHKVVSKEQSDSTSIVNSYNKLHEELMFLDAFVSRKNVDNKQFTDWQRNKFIYTAGKAILSYPFMGKINTSITDSQLIELIRPIPINNSSALYNSDYYEFLNLLLVDHLIIVNINPGYEFLKRENGNNTVAVNLDQIDKLAKGITREIMYYDLYFTSFQAKSRKNIPSITSDRFQSVIMDSVLNKMLKRLTDSLEDGFKPYHIVSRIRELKVSDNLKTRLLEIFRNSLGSNVFIDFWGDWCGPCMNEMPAYSKLIDSFKDKPLKFIFLSAHTSDKSAEQIKNRYQIKGDFINLTNDEVAIMNIVFEFHAYPAHFVVNAHGDVVGRDIKKEEEISLLLFK